MTEVKFRVFYNGKMHYWGILDKDSFTMSPTVCWDRYPPMQYTGLKDKNDVEIYEGDILDFDPKEFGHEVSEIITIDKLIKGNYYGTLLDIELFRAVIGNTYENPELLED